MIWWMVVTVFCFISGLLFGVWLGSTPKVPVDNMIKLLKVKLISDDFNELKGWTNAHLGYLNEEQVSLLVSRMEEIRADNIINGDDLKKRIDDEWQKSRIVLQNEELPIETFPIVKKTKKTIKRKK